MTAARMNATTATLLGRLAVVLGVACATPSVVADERDSLAGAWKLTSFVIEFQATGERRPVLGNNPRGHVVFTPEGRTMVVVTGSDRKPAQTNDERAALLTTMLAYSGMYSVQGDQMVIKIDTSWNEAWVGTDQVRLFKVDGDRLDVSTRWAPSTLIPDRPMTRAVVSFQRER
jgi:hypothetical protein